MQRFDGISSQTQNVIHEEENLGYLQDLSFDLVFVFIFRVHERQGYPNLYHQHPDL